MARVTTLLVGLLMALSPFAFAQDSPSAPQSPEDAFTAQPLIAWTHLQQPQPMPQPIPPREDAVPQPDQPQDEQPKPPGDARTERQPAPACTQSAVKSAVDHSSAECPP